ncbi:ketopantoate reductase family protein [Lichenicoccus sp.]|uniref:ketopantoate reductase family protein n=1 Tax=Lichenicoccus sp. TaxID=2781899 RepID=UPI003D0A04CC
MRVLVVGAGATGGYFGGRLAQAGRDVSFLVRAARAAHLRAHGLQIVSPHGDVTLQPRLLLASEVRDPFDVVLLAVKSFAFAAAVEDLAPAVGPQSMIVPLLNGMRHIDGLVARFGAAPVLGGVCRIAGDLAADGRIVQMTPMHDVSYGERSGSRSVRIERLDALLQGAGFDARLSEAIEREMWEKWLVLATLGGIGCLMRGTLGDILAQPGGRDFIGRFLDEVLAIVAALGHAADAAFEAFARRMFTQPGGVQTSSMYRDLQKGAPVEADQILGDLLARGQGAGVDAPLLNAAFTQLSIYMNRH